MTENILSSEKIMRILPHRYPFIFVDKVVDCSAKSSIVTIKNFTRNEEFFNGHFPDMPVAPGVILLEAMAQSAMLCFFWEDDLTEQPMAFFASIENAKFRSPILPGDTAYIKAEMVKSRGTMVWYNCEIHVDEKKTCEALLCASFQVKKRI